MTHEFWGFHKRKAIELDVLFTQLHHLLQLYLIVCVWIFLWALIIMTMNFFSFIPFQTPVRLDEKILQKILNSELLLCVEFLFHCLFATQKWALLWKQDFLKGLGV